MFPETSNTPNAAEDIKPHRCSIIHGPTHPSKEAIISRPTVSILFCSLLITKEKKEYTAIEIWSVITICLTSYNIWKSSRDVRPATIYKKLSSIGSAALIFNMVFPLCICSYLSARFSQMECYWKPKVPLLGLLVDIMCKTSYISVDQNIQDNIIERELYDPKKVYLITISYLVLWGKCFWTLILWASKFLRKKHSP